MSRGSYILAYDLGTTGNKATLFDPDGQIVASAYHGYETTYPQPGWSEQHPEDWWESIVASTRELLQSSGIHPSDIIAIGLSGHMMGCLPVDGDGEPLRAALIHSDTRSMLQCERIQSLIGADRFFEITGQILDPHYTLPKILWLKDNEPHVYERTRFFLQCKDYVRFKLTDELGITDFSDASLSGAYDLHTCQWSDELLTALEVSPKLLPEVHPSSAVIGMVTKEAADATGLVAGTPVVAGAGDGSCATFGAGVTRAGQAYNYLGGTSWIAALTDGLVLDMQQRLFTMGHVEFARFAIIGTVQCAGSSYQWLADEICWFERESARERDASQFDLMNELARSAPVGSHKLFFLPYLMGERSPIWDPHARGVFLGLSLAHRRSDIIRSVLEGIAYALKSILVAIEELGVLVENVRVIGGGAESALWRQILADVYGKELLIPQYVGEATSIGAALTAGVGVGIYRDFHDAGKCVRIIGKQAPDQNRQAQYRKLFDFYQSLYPALRDTFRRLAQLDI